MIKYFPLVFLIFFLSACARDNLRNKSSTQNTALLTQLIPGESLSKNYIIEHYKGNELSIYKKEKIQSITDEIKKGLKDIYSLEKSDILNVVGSPVLIKNEGSYEVWQYRTPYCVLNFIWDNKTFKISSIVSYSVEFKNVNTKDCLVNTMNFNPENNKDKQSNMDRFLKPNT